MCTQEATHWKWFMGVLRNEGRQTSPARRWPCFPKSSPSRALLSGAWRIPNQCVRVWVFSLAAIEPHASSPANCSLHMWLRVASFSTVISTWNAFREWVTTVDSHTAGQLIDKATVNFWLNKEQPTWIKTYLTLSNTVRSLFSPFIPSTKKEEFVACHHST